MQPRSSSSSGGGGDGGWRQRAGSPPTVNFVNAKLGASIRHNSTSISSTLPTSTATPNISAGPVQVKTALNAKEREAVARLEAESRMRDKERIELSDYLEFVRHLFFHLCNLLAQQLEYFRWGNILWP